MPSNTTTVVLEDDGTVLSADRRQITGRLIRGRTGRSITFRNAPPPPVAVPEIKPASVACVLAAAYWVLERVETGEFRDLADAARHFGITRARMTQIMDLTLLAPEIQEQILDLEGPGGRCAITERQLRHVTRTGLWMEQLRQFKTGA